MILKITNNLANKCDNVFMKFKKSCYILQHIITILVIYKKILKFIHSLYFYTFLSP